MDVWQIFQRVGRCHNVLEVFTGDISVASKVLVEEDEDGRQNTEKSAETEDDEVTNTLREGRLSSKEGVLTSVSRKGRTFNGSHGWIVCC